MKKFLKGILTTAIGSMVLLSANISAAPVLIEDMGEVVGIHDLKVGGSLYDVYWETGPYNDVFSSDTPLFLGEWDLALEAATGMLDVFNSFEVEVSDLGGGLECSSVSSDCDILVPWSINKSNVSAFNVDWRQANGPWVLQEQNWGRYASYPVVAYARFTDAVKVPAPATLALLGLCFAAAGFRKKLA